MCNVASAPRVKMSKNTQVGPDVITNITEADGNFLFGNLETSHGMTI